jgi:hypothetical protein
MAAKKKKTAKGVEAEAKAAAPEAPSPDGGSGEETVQSGAFSALKMVVIGRPVPEPPPKTAKADVHYRLVPMERPRPPEELMAEQEPAKRPSGGLKFSVMSPRRRKSSPAPSIGSTQPQGKP